MPYVPTRYGPVLGRWADFSRGEYGAAGGRKAQTGQWSGRNVVPYLDGSIGPRAGLRSLQPTEGLDGVPVGILVVSRERGGNATIWVVDSDGQVWATPYTQPVDDWFIYSDPVALSDDSSSVIDTVDDGRDTYLTSFGEETYRLNHATNVVTALPGSPGGRCITIYGERLVVGCPADFIGNHLRWSEPNDYETWPATNFLALGKSGDIIKSLQVQRNVLVVTMEHGDIYTVSGALSVNDATREVTSIAPREALINAQRVSVTKRGIIWRRGRNAVPESFDGADLRGLTYLNDWLSVDESISDIAICQGADDDDVLMFGSYGALLQLHNGAWSRHTLGLHGLPGSGDDPLSFSGIFVAYDGHDRAIVATNLDDTAIHPALYDMALGLERPPVASLGDTVEDAGTGLQPTCVFTTPELRDSAGRSMAPSNIVVRFTKYANGAVEDNGFSVFLNRHDIYESEQTTPINCGQFLEDNALASEAGTRCEKRFGVPPNHDASAVSVTIAGIRGCSIQEIILHGEVEGARP